VVLSSAISAAVPYNMTAETIHWRVPLGNGLLDIEETVVVTYGETGGSDSHSETTISAQQSDASKRYTWFFCHDKSLV
jgi:hypothetical protein